MTEIPKVHICPLNVRTKTASACHTCSFWLHARSAVGKCNSQSWMHHPYHWTVMWVNIVSYVLQLASNQALPLAWLFYVCEHKIIAQGGEPGSRLYFNGQCASLHIMQHYVIIDLCHMKSHMPEIWLVVKDPKLLSQKNNEMAQSVPDPSSGEGVGSANKTAVVED